MKFLIIPQGCLPFHAGSLEERPLGGIETGVIRVGEELSALGHTVTIITGIDNPPLSTPLYLPFRALQDIRSVDVLIAVREWAPLLLPIEAKRRLFWTGDSYDQPQNLGIGDPRVSARIDGFLAVSHWHADRLSQESGFPRGKCWVIRNGVKLEYFSGTETRLRKRMMYSSTPYRGLQFVPLIYRELKRRHADAELHVFSGYQVYAGAAPPPKQAVAEYEALRQDLSSIPGCTVHGNVRQRELAREFMKSALLLYPNTFEETSCITALEAQAAGCAIVSSQLGALPETVRNAGALIPGRPGTPEYMRAFVDVADAVLRDDALFEQLSRAGKRQAQESDWQNVALRILQGLEQLR